MQVARRGLTLIEALVVLALVAVALSLSYLNLPERKKVVQGRALAERLASLLQELRRRAIAEDMPAGVVFPGACSQSLECLQGYRHPRRIRTESWAGELPEGRAFCGTWALAGGPGWADPVASDGFDPESWAERPGPVYVFTPNGRLHSNQKTFQDRYCILAGSAFQATAGNLTAAREPWCVQLSEAGEVHAVAGLPGAQIPSANLSDPGATALSPPRGTNHNPAILRVEPMPPPAPGSLPPGIDASVRPGDYISFSLQARDADGDPLRCVWNCAQGQFSARSETRMEWDSGQQWTGVWTFTPPPNAVVNSVYTLNCTVFDDRGGSTTATFGVGGKLLVTRRPKLLLSSSGPGNQDLRNLYTSNVDGTGRQLIFPGQSTIDSPRWSPDGSALLFLYDPVVRGIQLNLWLGRPQVGTSRLFVDRTTYGWYLVAAADFMPDGTKIAIAGYRNGNYDVGWIRVDGKQPGDPTQTGVEMLQTNMPGNVSFTGMEVHPQTGHIVLATEDGRIHAFTTNPGAAPLSVVQPPPPAPSGPDPLRTQLCFSPDGTRIYLNEDYRTISWHTYSDTGTTVTIGPPNYICNETTYQVQGPHATPDGLFLYYVRGLPGGRLHILRRELATGVEYDLTTPGDFDDDCWCSP